MLSSSLLEKTLTEGWTYMDSSYDINERSSNNLDVAVVGVGGGAHIHYGGHTAHDKRHSRFFKVA